MPKIEPSSLFSVTLQLSQKNHLLHFHGRVDPQELIFQLTQYDFGWAGFNDSNNSEHLEMTLANKVFEYISAGLPVISYPHKTQKEFLEGNNLGIIISSINEFPSVLRQGEIEKVKQEVMRRRFDFTVEKNIGIVEEFYQRVVDYSRK